MLPSMAFEAVVRGQGRYQRWIGRLKSKGKEGQPRHHREDRGGASAAAFGLGGIAPLLGQEPIVEGAVRPHDPGRYAPGRDPLIDQYPIQASPRCGLS
jgi:hypothetical protein